MGPMQAASVIERETRASPLKIVTLTGQDGPLMLECKGLKVGLSLQRYVEKGSGPHGDIERQREIGEVALGLRRDLAAVGDAIQALVQMLRAGGAIEPVKVLARREPSGHWSSTGWVVDGAIRVQAAIEAGVPEIPAWLVTPALSDTPIEAMFLYCNATHGNRLTVAERDTILRILGRRYIHARPQEPRSATVFAEWLAPRSGMLAGLVAEVVRNEFQVRTPEKYAEAERLLRGGKTPGEIAKMPGMPSRAAIEKQAKKLRIPSPGKRNRDHRAGASPREDLVSLNGAKDATPELILESRIERIDPRATARDLTVALKGAHDNLNRAFRQIRDWGLKEAAEYRIEQAKIVWDVIDQQLHWYDTLQFNAACRIYRDRYLARRDLPLLKQIVAQAEATLSARSRAPRIKPGRTKRGR